MLFQNAQNTDVRHAIINDVAGNQYNEFNLQGSSCKDFQLQWSFADVQYNLVSERGYSQKA